MKYVTILVLLSLLLVACGGDDDDDTPEASLPTATTAAAIAATDTPSEDEANATSAPDDEPVATEIQPSTAASAPVASPTATTAATEEPTATAALDAPDTDLADALPPLENFPAGWTVEYPDTDDEGDAMCGIAPVSSVTTIEEEVEADYAGSGGLPSITVSMARLDDAEAALDHYISQATCTEFTTEDGVQWSLREMSFPDLGDGEMWARSATVISDGVEADAEIVVFRSGDVMVLIGQIGHLVFGALETDITVMVAEYVADELD